MVGRIELTSGPGKGPARSAAQGRPMRILVLSGCSGWDSQGQPNPNAMLGKSTPVAVDIDNFDEVLARANPSVCLPIGRETGKPIKVAFDSLDDFHPDALYRRLGIFKECRELRARLADPMSFSPAAAELRQAAVDLQQGQEVFQPSTLGAKVAREEDTATFERLLGSRSAGTGRLRTGHETGLTEFIRDIVAPHITPAPDPYQPIYIASVDEAASQLLRTLLHHPAFQALEAAWRSLHLLVSNMETGEKLQLDLLDVSKQALREDLQAARDNITSTGLYRLLVKQTAGVTGEPPWSLLIGNYTFGSNVDDINLLAALGGLASQAGGPFLAAADPAILGCRSVHEAPDPDGWGPIDAEAEARWHALRKSPVARWIGLALPRLLLRLPYAPETDPIESFAFTELTGTPDHEHYLWGNPAMGCALLIATSFLQHGWAMQLNERLQLDGLPAYSYQRDGEVVMQPCAELYLTERAAPAIQARGLMPWLSYKNRNTVRLAGFQSLADVPADLSFYRSSV